MNLPRFRESQGLNRLRGLMGIPADVFGDFTKAVEVSERLTAKELREIEDRGLDVSLDQITFLGDGTLAYKDTRVIVYIRDHHAFRNQPLTPPKFHFFFCSTLERMKSNNRFNKYVVATELSGFFKINVFTQGIGEEQRVPLKVCICCLKELPFEGFSGLKQQARTDYVDTFKPRVFFEKFPKKHNFVQKPKHTDKTARKNIYPDNWSDISRNFRKRNNWTCMNQSCNRLLDGKYTQYLHVHHLDGDRSNNLDYNLKALCLECHTNEPMHNHLKSSFQYKQFIQLVRSGVISKGS
jgi:hypothetical protein